MEICLENFKVAAVKKPVVGWIIIMLYVVLKLVVMY